MIGFITDITIAGNVTADPKYNEPRDDNSNRVDASATFTIAVNRRIPGALGELKEVTDFYPIYAYRKSAEIARDVIKKGSSVMVKCSIQPSTYEQDGKKKTNLQLIAHYIFVGVKYRPGDKPQGVGEDAPTY